MPGFFSPVRYGVFSGPYFPVIGLSAEIYFVNLPVQFRYGKIQARKNSISGLFSRSVTIHS